MVASFQGLLLSVTQVGKDDTDEVMKEELRKARDWLKEEELKAEKAA